MATEESQTIESGENTRYFLVHKLTIVIFFRILRTTTYSTIALTLCAWIVQSSRYLDMLAQYNISLATFFKFSSYLCVDILALILPIAFAISSAFVFYRFVQSRQLIAMQSVGISPTALLRPLITLALLITGYIYASNAYVSPNAWASFRQMEFEIKNHIEPVESAGSIIALNGFSVYAKKYVGDFTFRDIFVLDLRDPVKIYSYYAQSGSIKRNMLFMKNGERIELDKSTRRNSITKFDSYQYDLKAILNIKRKKAQPNEIYMLDLLNNNSKDDETDRAMVAMFHQKMTSPLLVLIFAFLSFLLMIMAPYKRRQTNVRLLLLIILIVVFQGTFFWVTNAAAKDLEFVEYIYALVGTPIAILPLLILWWNR